VREGCCCSPLLSPASSEAGISVDRRKTLASEEASYNVKAWKLDFFNTAK
jgi:hypothetical protein